MPATAAVFHNQLVRLKTVVIGGVLSKHAAPKLQFLNFNY